MFKNVSTSSLLFVVCAILIGALVFAYVPDVATAVPVIAVLFGLLYVGFVGLLNNSKEQALGLPEGSIRALIAIGISSAFIWMTFHTTAQASNGSESVIQGLTLEKALEFKDRAAVQIVPEALKSAGPATNAAVAPAPVQTYTVRFKSTDQNLRDNANQLVTALITLVSSIASFYFAAASVNQATQRGIEAGKASNQPGPGSASVTSAEYDPKGAKVIVTGTGLNTISQLDLRLDSGSPVISTNQLSLDGDKLTADFKDHPIPPGNYQVAVVVANGPSVPTQTKLTVVDSGAANSTKSIIIEPDPNPVQTPVVRNGDPDASPEANPASRQEAFQVPVSIQSADFDTPGSLKIDGKGLGQIACVLLIPENGDNLVSETLSEGDTERIAMSSKS